MKTFGIGTRLRDESGGSGAEFLFLLFITLLVMLAFGAAAYGSVNDLWDNFDCEYGDELSYLCDGEFPEYVPPTIDFSYLTPSPPALGGE